MCAARPFPFHTGPSVAAAFLPGEPFNTSPTSYSSLSTADRTGVYQHASYDQSVLHHYTPANARQLYPSVRMSSFSSSTGSPISPAQSASPFIPDRPLHPSVAPMIQPPSVGFVNHQQLRSSTSGWWAADDLRGRQAWFASSVRRPPPLVSPTHATSSSFYAVAHTRPFRTQAAVAPPISSPAISQASSALASRQSATRRRKMVVRLPLSGKADHRVPLSPTTQATVAAKMSEDGAHLVEPASRRPHFEEGTRDGLPDTLDVYLPGQIAWQDLREEFAVRLRTEPSLSMEYGQKPDAGRPKQLHSRSRSLFTPPQLLPPRFRTAGAHDEGWRGHRLAKSLTTTTDFVNEAVSGNRADLLTWPPLSIGQPRLESVFAPDNLAGRISSPVPPAYLESDKSQDGDAESTDYAGRCHTASPRFPGSAAFESDGDIPEQGVVVFDGGARSASLNPGALTFQPVASVPMMRTNSPLLAKGTRRPLPPLPIPQTKLPAESSHRSIGFASPVPVLVELKHPQPRRPLPPSPLEASESDADAAPANSLRTGLQAPLDDAERSSTSFEDPLPEQYAPARMYSQQRSIPKDRFAALEPSRPRDAVDGVGQLRPSASSPARMGDPRALQHELARQRAPSGETELAFEAGLSELPTRDVDAETVVSTVADDLPLRILETLIDERFGRLGSELAAEVAKKHAALLQAVEVELSKCIRQAMQPVLEKANSSLSSLDRLVNRLAERKVVAGTTLEQPPSDSEQQDRLRESELTLVEEDSQNVLPHTEIASDARAITEAPMLDKHGWYSSS